MKKIIIIDNDISDRTALATLLRDHGFEIDEASTEEDAMQLLTFTGYDLAIMDLCFSGHLSLDVLKRIKNAFVDLDVIIATASKSVDNVVRTIKMGALNYVTKPINAETFLPMIHEFLHRGDNRPRSLRCLDDQFYCYRVDDIVGVSRSMESVVQRALRVTDIDSGILIRGESGTGKELVARIIHNHSTLRREKEFIAINCSAIPNDILESELFGFRQGAFTGATSNRKGLIETADGGTFFMDEIGDTTPQFQAKLLRVIQEKEIRRVGDTTSRRVDVRIIAATNRDLRQMISEGTFREDLFYRLNVIDLFIPPLRERKEDIQPLIDYFLLDVNKRLGKDVKGISAQARTILSDYDWPGNIRELKNSIERAVVFSEHNILQPEDFPLAFEYSLKHAEEGQKEDDILPMKEMERRYLLKAMKKYKNDQKLMAKKLGIGYTTLWRKLKDLDDDTEPS